MAGGRDSQRPASQDMPPSHGLSGTPAGPACHYGMKEMHRAVRAGLDGLGLTADREGSCPLSHLRPLIPDLRGVYARECSETSEQTE